MIDRFGRRALREAAGGVFSSAIPPERRDECAAVGRKLIGMAAEQRAYEQQIDSTF